jgi:beta-galactosidase
MGWLNARPAVVFRNIGKGTLTYVGTLPDPELLSRILTGNGPTGAVRDGPYDLPSDIELCARSGSTQTVYVAINHGSATRELRMPLPMRNLLQPGRPASTSFTLQPQGVAVLVWEPAQ